MTAVCLLVLSFRELPGRPLLLAANRDEAYARASRPPEIVRDDAFWLGGRDYVAGGTWLGLNQHALVVAVTNRSDRPVPVAPRSRGLLCRALLQCASPAAAQALLDEELRRHDFAGFNLLTASREEAVVAQVGRNLVRQTLSPGTHLLVNSGLNDRTDERAERARREFERVATESRDGAAILREASGLLGLAAGNDGPALCLHGEDGGTVSATVIALPDDPSQAEYLFADGPPCRTPFASYSPLACEVLAAGKE